MIVQGLSERSKNWNNTRTRPGSSCVAWHNLAPAVPNVAEGDKRRQYTVRHVRRRSSRNLPRRWDLDAERILRLFEHDKRHLCPEMDKIAVAIKHGRVSFAQHWTGKPKISMVLALVFQFSILTSEDLGAAICSAEVFSLHVAML
jgi:hypothetical protein